MFLFLVQIVIVHHAIAQDAPIPGVTDGIFALGSDDTIHAMIEDEDGNLYFGGDFRELGGVSGRIVMYDGENWHSLGFPDANMAPTVNALAIRGDYLYAGGNFTSIQHNGQTVSARRLARYHMPSGTWTEAGGGVNQIVRTIEVIDGTMYVGGDFTFAYADPENVRLNRIGILNSSGNWTPFRTGSENVEFIGFNNGSVRVIYRDPDTNRLYIGGSFSTVTIYDPSHTQSDGYRTAFSGGIVSWSGTRFSLVGGGLHIQSSTSIQSGTVLSIRRDPHGAGLMVGGNFGMAYQSERTETALSTHDPETDPQTAGIAIWDGAEWSNAMSLSDSRAGGVIRVYGMHFTDNRIYLYGTFNGTIRPLANFEGTSIRAEGIVAWDRSAEEYLVTNNQSALGYSVAASTVSASGLIRASVSRQDGLFLAGSIPRYILPGQSAPTQINNLMRYDGESFWQVGLGVDGFALHTIARMSDGTYIIGGNFRHLLNHDHDNHVSPLVARYDPDQRRLTPLGRGIGAGGVANARVLAIVENPANGDIYVTGAFTQGINSDGSTVTSNGLLRWSNEEWQAVTPLLGGGSRYIPKGRTLRIVDDYLYFGGFFSSIPDRHPNQLSIGRMHLGTGEFTPIPFPDTISMTDRMVSDITVMGDHIYILVESHNQASSYIASVLRIHRETDQIESYNFRFRGQRTHERIQPWGEFLLLTGRFTGYDQINEDGTLGEFILTGTNSFILHAESGELWTFAEWFDSNDFSGGSFAYDALAHENAFYLATGGNTNGIALQKLDLGTREWSRAAPDLGSSVFARSPSGTINHLLQDEDRLWLSGLFSVPGNKLAVTGLDGGTPAPHMLFNMPVEELSLQTGDRDTLHLSFGNIGSEALSWNIHFAGENLPENMLIASASSGSVGSRSYGTVQVRIDLTDVQTNLYEVEITLATNDAGFGEVVLPLRIFVNRLTNVSDPSPEDQSNDIPISNVLRWNGDSTADSVVVYLDVSPDFSAESIVYAGAYTDSLSLAGLVQYFTRYYWKVEQINAASVTEGPVWSFTTVLDPEERQWVRIPTDFTTSLNDIHVVSQDTILVAGTSIVYRSVDGGETWEQLTDDLVTGLRYGFYASGSTIWLGRSSGNLAVTSDGGETWLQRRTEVTTNMRSIFFLDEHHGWVGGDNGSLQRTTDGGETWTVVDIGNFFRINHIYFVDALTGYLAGMGGLFMKTTDGGDTWSTISTGFTTEFHSMLVRAEDHVMLGTQQARLLETLDGGETWEVLYSTTRSNDQIRDIRFENDETGFAVGQGGFNTPLMLITFDGGGTWAERPVPVEGGFVNGLFTGEDTGVWAVGTNGSVLRYLDVTIEEPEPEPQIPVAIRLLVPENGATDVAVQPEFSWLADALATSYQIQVAENAGFSTLLVNQSGLSDTTLISNMTLQNNTTYYWRVRGINTDGSGDWSEIWSFSTRTGVSVEHESNLPKVVTLQQNYPNPFNPVTSIRFGLPETADVRLEVYNVLGQRVAVLAQERREAGWHTVQFNGSALSSGTYLYRLTAGDTVQSRMLMLIK